jgi:glycine/D-amino acid oxidase-like deaminating enzyme
MKSIWNNTTTHTKLPSLDRSIKTDVLIIGGGMAGILCAYHLKQAGADCVLVEAGRIGAGITKNTTAKITSQHGLIYDKLIKNAGLEKARMYLQANQSAIAQFKRLSEKIPCTLEEKDAFVFSLSGSQAIEREVRAVNRLGFKAQFTENIPLPFKTAGAVRFEKQAQLNPLQFLYGIASGLKNVYENTTVRELANNTAITDNAKIKAEKIIIAAHFPFLNKHGSYFLKMYQRRSYVIAVEGAENVDGMYIQDVQDGISLRNYNDLLLIGGGGHRTGENGGNWQELRRFASKFYPKAVEKYAWAAQDCMTLDSIPYIGRYSGSTRNLYVCTGFNKWGMTGSMVGAMILTDKITGRKNPYAEVFSPQRSILKPQLAVNGVTAVKNLLTPSVRRCPHMGCALKWNRMERTWDCPCHGSRFEKNGKLIDNPATGDLK